MLWNCSLNETCAGLHDGIEPNSTTDPSFDTENPSTGSSLALALFLGYVVIVVPNIAGNSLVLLAIYRTKSLQTFSYYLLANLAVSDIVVAFSACAEAIFFMFLNSYSKGWVCSFVRGGLVTKLCAAVSIFTLTTISIERYYGIVKPLSSQIWLRRLKIKTIVSIIWLVALLFTLPIAYYLVMGFNSHCDFVNPKSLWINIVMLCLTFLGYILPLVISSAGLYRICKVLWGSLALPGTSASSTIKSRKRVTRLLGVVLLVFFLCTIPHFGLAIAAFLGYFELNHPAFRIAYLLLLANSSVNPIIYCFNGTAFRRAMKGILTGNTYVVDSRSIYSSRSRYQTQKIATNFFISGNTQVTLFCNNLTKDRKEVYDTKL